ncbi:MAG TPA: GNAT family N-acetyltransferase [Candidatus Limnocylindrales bacterium]
MRSYFMRTPRLGFGMWSRNDLDLAMGLWGDARVTHLIGGPFSERWVRDRLAQEISTQSALGFQYWPLFRLADDAHVGCCGLRPVPGGEGILELGFHLRIEYWGLGFATESSRAVIEYAFTTLGTAALVAGHHPENDASRRVLQRLGFRYTRDEHYAPTGLDHPSYELRADEYRGVSVPGS